MKDKVKVKGKEKKRKRREEKGEREGKKEEKEGRSFHFTIETCVLEISISKKFRCAAPPGGKPPDPPRALPAGLTSAALRLARPTRPARLIKRLRFSFERVYYC